MVFSNIKKAITRSDVKEIAESLKKSASQFKEEFEDHLDTINQNTNEIQSNYEYLCEIDSKIEKLNERIDELFMLFRQNSGIKEPSFEIHPLTKREKEVFMALYALEEELDRVSYDDLAKRLGLTISLVQAYLMNLTEKGVPILKRYINNKAYIRLDPVFRALQAKKNIIGTNEMISEKVVSF